MMLHINNYWIMGVLQTFKVSNTNISVQEMKWLAFANHQMLPLSYQFKCFDPW